MAVSLTLASGARLGSVKISRDSKWDIIHHEYHGPPAPLSKDGRVIDTQEVADAKANHLLIHAETIADLAKKMAEANWHEPTEKKAEKPAEELPMINGPIQMTPKMMAALMAAVAEEQKTQQEQQKAVEALPESAPIVVIEPSRQVPPIIEPSLQIEAEEVPKVQEVKPVVELEVNNEIENKEPTKIPQKSYEGPLAQLGEDGRVLDTPEVQKAKELHLLAYKKLAELTKSKDGHGNKEESGNGWAPVSPSLHQLTRIYLPPMHIIYPPETSIGYGGPPAPIGENGKVMDTVEVELAKAAHKKAHEHAEAIAKRHPPRAEDNTI
ncbi:hypothetical protein TKK_0015115 [Trichogramma kaykai]|uniref:Uncharacterized protein n=1 Tax=Trichogramma kaykai TaxID=54128 RepID=A0ABD2WAB6_9HYME